MEVPGEGHVAQRGQPSGVRPRAESSYSSDAPEGKPDRRNFGGRKTSEQGLERKDLTRVWPLHSSLLGCQYVPLPIIDAGRLLHSCLDPSLLGHRGQARYLSHVHS